MRGDFWAACERGRGRLRGVRAVLVRGGAALADAQGSDLASWVRFGWHGSPLWTAVREYTILEANLKGKFC